MTDNDSQKLDQIIKLLGPLQLTLGRIEGELRNLREAIQKGKATREQDSKQP